ncbi:hypothetical protein OKW21_003298 [Catalinimonas alkaloidigena]|nr:hypothetical protein [Catalinimonas alkaloidigena]
MTSSTYLLLHIFREGVWKDKYILWISIITLLLLMTKNAKSQTIVGMGTENPNPNAVLELVSTQRDQGLLVPRLLKIEANALSEKLSAADNGLLIFVEDEGKFFYWWEESWHKLDPSNGDISPEITQLKPGKGIKFEENIIHNTGDRDSTNELQNLSSVLSLGTDAGGKRISNVADPLDAQEVATRNFVMTQFQQLSAPSLMYDETTLSLSISGGNTIELGSSLVKKEDLKLSISNNTLTLENGESVDLSGVNTDKQALDLVGDELSITNGNTVNFSKYKYKAGSGIGINSKNEIINTAPDIPFDITGSGAVIVTKSGSDYQVSVADLNDADANPTNEIQDLTLGSNELKITNNPSATAINLLPYLDNTDAQTLSLSGSQLEISGGNIVDLSSLQGNSYTAGSGIDINGSDEIINTAPDQTVSITGSGAVSVSGTYPNFTVSATDNVNDADSDSGNEIQDLSLINDELKITNNASASTIDLSSYLDNTDAQTLTTSGTSLEISNGNTVNLGGLVGATTLTEGNIWVGSNADKAIAFDASADAQILVGNGTTVASVSITGDLVLQSDGTFTLKNTVVTTNKIADGAVTNAKLANNAITETKISDDAVTRDKINSNVAGTGLIQAVDGSLETINTNSGELLIGQGSTVASRSISGDISLDAIGNANISKLQGKAVNAPNPANGQVLGWNGSAWVPSNERSDDEARWFTGTINPESGSFSGGQVGDLYYRHNEDRYWRKTGTDSDNWAEISGLGGGGENGKRMNGQLNIGSQPALADRQNGMLWLDSSGNGSIKRWNGSSWNVLISGD